MTKGTTVKVFGKKLATVVKLSTNGKRVLLTGEHVGWTGVRNVTTV